MPLHLDRTLSWKKALAAKSADDAAMLAMLGDLQGNILKGHGRDHAVHLFLSFRKSGADKARAFLSELGQEMPSALDQLIRAQVFKSTGADAGRFLAVFLSASGYDVLGLSAVKPEGTAFRAGMKQRRDVLADPPPAQWEATFTPEVHGMILLANDDPKALERASATMRQRIASLGGAALVLGVETGLALRNADDQGIEHFGYVDGRSQPLMLDEDLRSEARSGGITKWNPKVALGQVLLPCPGSALESGCGSFFVFRKLAQDVRGFRQRESALAAQLGAGSGTDPGALAGAYVVGRFRNGTPVSEADAARHPTPLPVSNNFNFRNDPRGLRCPFAGHIRKTNPRDPTIDSNARLMARRGITYGARTDDPVDDRIDDKPDRGVGLLFMAYQKSIDDQFEFTQQSWADNTGFHFGSPAQPVGIDPVIGQPPSDGSQRYPLRHGAGPLSEPFDFSGFVSLKGGEYFFAPSLSFFKRL